MGRKKKTIVLSNGKNICPEEVENVIESNLEYANDIVVYQAELRSGNFVRETLVAGLYIEDPDKRADIATLMADFKRINALLPDYKRIEYIELPAQEYEKTSTRKIRRTTLPTSCSGTGISLI